jgi:hypothetical protein
VVRTLKGIIILKHNVKFFVASSQFSSELTVPSYVVVWFHFTSTSSKNQKFVNRQSGFFIATPTIQTELNNRDGLVERHWFI